MLEPIPHAVFTLTIEQFRSLGGVFPISSDIKLTKGDPTVFSVDGGNIIIHLPLDIPVQLTFKLPGTDHVLLGIAFDADTPRPKGRGNEFPKILIERSPKSCRLTVTDQGRTRNYYNYLLLIQDVATSEIGMIDPRIANEPN